MSFDAKGKLKTGSILSIKVNIGDHALVSGYGEIDIIDVVKYGGGVLDMEAAS